MSDPIWRGEQWQVTDHGLETIKPGVYDVHRGDLGDLCGNGGAGPADELFWPNHVLAKSWVDINEFAEAFAQAVAIHSRWADMPPFWQIQLGRIAERAALRREAEAHGAGQRGVISLHRGLITERDGAWP